ncbi:MAG TPA: carbamoyltransferase N-terminal domain-containing protein, partial [Candidatus Nanoarchaeia archaeon]|nr:carbamoyltransferase N-terminal domain-containing protein [Candidatus Nanoarchaeia archaeon]
MTFILGIHDAAHDSGATLLKDGNVMAAIHEERVNRVKHAAGFPWKSIPAVLAAAHVHPSEIDRVAVGFSMSEFPMQLMQGYFHM